MSSLVAESLAKKRDLLRTFLENIPTAVAALDRDMRYLAASRRWIEFYRLEGIDLLGRSHYDIFPEIPERWKEIHRRCLAGEEASSDRDPFPRADGTIDWIRWRIAPWRENAQRIGGILIFSEPITPSQQDEDDRLRLAAISGSPDDAVIGKALDGTITSWSKGAERVYGYAEREIIGQNISRIVPPEQITELADSMERLRRGEYIPHHETRRRRKDGRIIAVALTISPVRDERGRVVGATAIARDMTERKRLEDDLRRAKEEAEAAYRELEVFSYSVSHDLRAPLRKIDAFSQLILDDRAQRLGETGKDYLQRVRHAAQHMAELIDDLLELSRVSRSELHVEPVDLSALARAIADDLRSGDPGRETAFAVASGLEARGDPHLLRSALENLIGNAWKFTAKRPQALIEVGGERRDGRTVYFVRDNGAGFDPAYADKLFQPFHRLHRTDDFPGTGIGLATVQRILSRHGGKIWAEGALEKGATFYFTIE